MFMVPSSAQCKQNCLSTLNIAPRPPSLESNFTTSGLFIIEVIDYALERTALKNYLQHTQATTEVKLGSLHRHEQLTSTYQDLSAYCRVGACRIYFRQLKTKKKMISTQHTQNFNAGTKQTSFEPTTRSGL